MQDLGPGVQMTVDQMRELFPEDWETRLANMCSEGWIVHGPCNGVVQESLLLEHLKGCPARRNKD
jgi:hypothetical protein